MTQAIVFDAYGTLYDIQSVDDVIEKEFPGYGGLVTQIWRLKQLEYTWLRSLMGRYEDFSAITRQSLLYALRGLGIVATADALDRILNRYLNLAPYRDARQTLADLSGHKRAILSNGSTTMLEALVCNTGLDAVLDAVISVDAKRIFKPHPEAYRLVEERLAVPPADVLFVSSNPFDVCGAKAFGFRVAWVERVKPEAMAAAFERTDLVTPVAFFKAIRTQMDELEFAPDHRIGSLSELPGLVG